MSEKVVDLKKETQSEIKLFFTQQDELFEGNPF